MELWLKTCLLLCSYGFFKEMKPSESFLTEYLLGPPQNLTESQVYYQVYPVLTYSNPALVIVVFLVTDLLRYRPVIWLEGVSYITTWSILIWGRGLAAMQAMQFTYAIAYTTEIAYSTYIYAKVSKEYYPRVTSLTRTALLLGRFLSALSAQLLTQYKVMDYYDLNYISLVFVSIAFVISCFLPTVETSMYFHKKDGSEEGEQTTSNESCMVKFKKVGNIMWTEFKEAYSNSSLLKWSIWWAVAVGIESMIWNYSQALYESIAPMDETETLYNGYVDATATILGTVSTMGVGYVKLNWNLLAEPILAIVSLSNCFMLLAMGLVKNIWVAYIGTIFLRACYQILMTIACFQIARELRAESYGLVFGFNGFAGMLMQSIISLIFISGLQIKPQPQFVIYGCLFGLIALVFIIFSSMTFLRLGWSGIKSQGLWEKKQSLEEDDQAELAQVTDTINT